MEPVKTAIPHRSRHGGGPARPLRADKAGPGCPRLVYSGKTVGNQVGQVPGPSTQYPVPHPPTPCPGTPPTTPVPTTRHPGVPRYPVQCQGSCSPGWVLRASHSTSPCRTFDHHTDTTTSPCRTSPCRVVRSRPFRADKERLLLRAQALQGRQGPGC